MTPTPEASTEKSQDINIPTKENVEAALPVPALVPSKAMIELFAAPALIPGKRERITLPPIVKPSQVSAGVSIVGIIQKLIASPIKSFLNDLLLLKHPSGREYCFPCTAVVKRALESKYGEFTLEKHSKLVGVTIQIDGLGQTKTVDGKRTVNLFEVSIITES